MRVRFALSGALLLLLGSCDIGQEITATILGTVVDSSGAAIAGATIIVVNTDQAVVSRGSATSRSGEYVVPLLPLGHYDVTALFNARPDQLGNANAHAPHTVEQWFDASLFADPPASGIRPGNAHRG